MDHNLRTLLEDDHFLERYVAEQGFPELADLYRATLQDQSSSILGEANSSANIANYSYASGPSAFVLDSSGPAQQPVSPDQATPRSQASTGHQHAAATNTNNNIASDSPALESNSLGRGLPLEQGDPQTVFNFTQTAAQSQSSPASTFSRGPANSTTNESLLVQLGSVQCPLTQGLPSSGLHLTNSIWQSEPSTEPRPSTTNSANMNCSFDPNPLVRTPESMSPTQGLFSQGSRIAQTPQQATIGPRDVQQKQLVGEVPVASHKHHDLKRRSQSQTVRITNTWTQDDSRFLLCQMRLAIDELPGANQTAIFTHVARKFEESGRKSRTASSVSSRWHRIKECCPELASVLEWNATPWSWPDLQYIEAKYHEQHEQGVEDHVIFTHLKGLLKDLGRPRTELAIALRLGELAAIQR